MLNAANITYSDLKNLTIEEMDNIIAAINKEKTQRLEAEITNATNKINNAIREARNLGFTVLVENETTIIEIDNMTLIQVTR